MSTLLVALVFLAWIASGVAATCYAIYTDSRSFRCPVFRTTLDSGRLFLGVVGGPITLLVVGVGRIFEATDHARAAKEAQIAALEEELSIARRELEELLGRVGSGQL